jgi:hypothetical protein
MKPDVFLTSLIDLDLSRSGRFTLGILDDSHSAWTQLQPLSRTEPCSPILLYCLLGYPFFHGYE